MWRAGPGCGLPLEYVPGRQKQIIRAARRAGSRGGGDPDARVHDHECGCRRGAEVSDVATAVFEGRGCRDVISRVGSRQYPLKQSR